MLTLWRSQWSLVRLTAALGAVAACGGCAGPRLTMLEGDASPLRAAFNAARGYPRVVALLSPT